MGVWDMLLPGEVGGLDRPCPEMLEGRAGLRPGVGGARAGLLPGVVVRRAGLRPRLIGGRAGLRPGVMG